jgi:hypothetical protein
MPRVSFIPLQPVRRPSTLSPSKSLISTASKSDSDVHAIVKARESSTITKSQKITNNGQENKKPQNTLQVPFLPVDRLSPNKRHANGDTQPANPDPTQAFLINAQTSFKHLVTGLQGFPGELHVQAEFGRVILRKINSRYVTLNENLESFPPQEILSQLLPNPEKNGNQIRTLFTNTLTTLSSDVSYLVDMNAATGQPMWEKTAVDSSLIYEISCHNERLAGWNPFTIEIDGETFRTRIKTRFDFGAVYVHGTLRHWDFRMIAFGFGDEDQNETLYGDFARAIQRSLHIP